LQIHKKKEIIIFCGASAEIQYALYIYDKNVNKADISIFCLHVKGMYKFLSSLNLNLKQLIFIPYPQKPSLKNPLFILKWKRYLKRIQHCHLKIIKYSEIYYFGRHYDWISYGCVIFLSKKNIVYNIDPYFTRFNNQESSVFLPRNFFRALIYKFITGLSLKFESVDESIRWYFDLEKYGIKKINTAVPMTIHNKYAYHVDCNLNSINILYFEADRSQIDSYFDYSKKLIEIMEYFKRNGVNVYLKPHPRAGYSKVLDGLGLQFIPDYIPGEMISLKGFNAVFGLDSLSIALKANNNVNISVYSLINLFFPNDSTHKLFLKNYLYKKSNGKIIFPYSMYEIKI
jgi:hypothetical protein